MPIKCIDEIVPKNLQDLKIIKSYGLSQFDPDELLRILWFYNTTEDEGGVFCTPFLLTETIYNGWPDSGWDNQRKYDNTSLDLSWNHSIWGWIIYCENGFPIHFNFYNFKYADVKPHHVSNLTYVDAIYKYFLRLDGNDICINNPIININESVFGINILDNELWKNYDKSDIDIFVRNKIKKMGDIYYNMAIEKIYFDILDDLLTDMFNSVFF